MIACAVFLCWKTYRKNNGKCCPTARSFGDRNSSAMKRNDLPGDEKSKAKMLFIFSGRIHSVETAKNIFSGSFRNAWTIIGNRKAELAVCLLAGLCFLYGLREFISIPGENSLSVFLERSYPDQDRAEEILKTVRKQENKTAIQAERIQGIFRGTAAFVLSLLLYKWQKKKA